MILLAIDTSTEYLGIALFDGKKMLGRVHKKAGIEHSRILVPSIAALLKKCCLRTQDIGCFCVSAGPGSFTGLRIGVSVLKGLAYALKKPIVAVPTLDVIAQNAIKKRGIICTVLDARKSKVYACIYRSNGKALKRLSAYMLLGPDSLLSRARKFKDVVFLGDAVKKNLLNLPAEIQTIERWHPLPNELARLGWEKLKKRQFVTAEKLEPMYLYSRECDITGR